MKNVRGVLLSEDEVVIREYEASNLELMNAKGFVIATNRRLIFTGSTKTAFGNSVLVRDTKIDSITGVMGGLSRKKSILQLIIGILIALVGIMSFSSSFLFALIGLALGGFIAYKGLKSKGLQMYVSVMSSQSSPVINVSVEAANGFFSRIKSNDAFLTVNASGPGIHTEQLIREIGALIQDIQTMGDLAIDKWRDKPLQSVAVETPSTIEQFSSTIQTVKEKAATATATIAEVKNQHSQPDKTNAYKACSCGSKVERDAAFCHECGGKFEESIFG